MLSTTKEKCTRRVGQRALLPQKNKLVTFGDENPGESIFGVTPEESRLLSGGTNDYQVGNIFATVYESNLDPVGTWTKAAGTALPSFLKRTNVLQATVLAEG